MRLLVVFLIIVLCVSVGGPLLRHHLLTKEAAINAESQPAAPPRIEASNTDIEFPEDPPDSRQNAEPIADPWPPAEGPAGPPEEIFVQTITIPKPSLFTIVGEALDAFSGEPVPGVQVHAIVWDNTLLRAQSALDFKGAPSATTDESGRFELSGLRAVTYALMTEHPTHVMTQPASKYIVHRHASSELQATLSMVEGGYVAGVASMMQFPLPNQEIVLKYKEDSRAIMKTKTDAYGAYMFAGLRSGSAVVSTDASSFGSPERMAIPTRIAYGQITMVDLRFGGLDAAIFGRIYPLEPDKQYVATAQTRDKRIDASVHTAEVNEDGSFYFSSLPSGAFHVTVEAHKRMYPKRKLEALIHTEQGKVSTHDFYFYSGYSADGYISNLQAGETLSVIATKTVRAPEISQRILRKIRNAATTYHAQVDERGWFWFEDLEPGSYMVVAEGAKGRIGVATINIEPDRYKRSSRLEPAEGIGLTLLDFRVAPEAM